MALAQNKSCCQLTITDQNNILAMNDNFAQAHLAPTPYKNLTSKGEMFTFGTQGKNGNAYLVKSSKSDCKKAIIIFHEWWGLNDYIKHEADEYATEFNDVDVYAIDLYDGQIANEAATAQKYMSGLTQERATELIKSLIKNIGDKKIAILGWCLGGAWSLQAAMLAEKKCVACVMYYGMPETNIQRLMNLNCDVLGIFATEDKFINSEIVQAFEENMKKAGKKLTVFKYTADHAFANPSNPKHILEYTLDAKSKVVSYLKLKFK